MIGLLNLLLLVPLLQDLEVGTDFDVKEQVFRNFGVPLGPNSDVTVVTRWSADTAVEEQAGEEDSLQHPHLVLADPTMTLVAEEFLTLESGEQVGDKKEHKSHYFTIYHRGN